MKAILAIFAFGGVALVLQGCGGGGSTTVTTTGAPAKKTTGTTTTTTLPPRTKPMTSQAMADHLNKLYLGFDEADGNSEIGVTISMAANETGFFANVFCSKFFNPAYHQVGGCHNGAADCRMSTAVLSHAWMLEPNKAIASFGGRRVGFVFNQTMVEQKWGRCSYIWDGASWNRYNRGCGDGAPSNECAAGKDSAFNNQCGSADSKHTCTTNDDEVKRAVCTVAGGPLPVPPNHHDHPQCVFPGPAFDYRGQDDYKPGKDYTRTMAKQRMKYNSGHDAEGENLLKNNEVVLDEEIMLHDMWENPITAIPAILYTEATNKGGINEKAAQKVRDDLCTVFGCAQNGGGLIPIVKIDDTKYFKTGPFFAADTSDDLNIAV